MAEAARSLDHVELRIPWFGLILATALFVIGWAGADFYFIPNFPWIQWPLVYLLPDVPWQWTDARTLWGASAVVCLFALMFSVGWKSTSRNVKVLVLWPALGLILGEFIGGAGHWTFLYNSLLGNQGIYFPFGVAEFAVGLVTVITSALLVVAAAALGRIARSTLRRASSESRQSDIRKRTIAVAVAIGLGAGLLGSTSDYGFSYVFLGLHLSLGPYYSALSILLSLGLISSPALIIAAFYLHRRTVMSALGYLAVLLTSFVAALWGFLLGFLFFAFETAAANVGPVTALSYATSKLGDIPGNAPAAASFSIWLSLLGFGALSISYLSQRSERHTLDP